MSQKVAKKLILIVHINSSLFTGLTFFNQILSALLWVLLVNSSHEPWLPASSSWLYSRAGTLLWVYRQFIAMPYIALAQQAWIYRNISESLGTLLWIRMNYEVFCSIWQFAVYGKALLISLIVCDLSNVIHPVSLSFNLGTDLCPHPETVC